MSSNIWTKETEIKIITTLKNSENLINLKNMIVEQKEK